MNLREVAGHFLRTMRDNRGFLGIGGGWNPFKDSWHIPGGRKAFTKPFRQLNNFMMKGIRKGSDLGWNIIGQASPDQKKRAEHEANLAMDAARKAAHDAEVAQLAQESLGAVALRRRRGGYSTRLTGSPSMGGGNPEMSGKTLLSQ